MKMFGTDCRWLGVVSNRGRALCAVLVLVLIVMSEVAAQVSSSGEWDGPYDNLPVNQYGGQTWATFEIAHAALLPPPIEVSGGTPRLSRSKQRIFLSAVPAGGCGTDCNVTPFQKWGRAYVWSPNRPTSVTEIGIPPTYPTDGSQDFFCSGHCFLPDGSLLVVGGTDKLSNCPGVPPCPVGGFSGHTGAWRLVTSSDTLEWVPAGSMNLARWYPTATLLHDGRVGVHGHTAGPGNPFDLNYADRWRDEFTSPVTWALPTPLPGPDPLHNQQYAVGCPTESSPLRLFDYPRLHLLSTGELFWPLAMLEPVSGVFDKEPAQFLDLLLPPCPGSLRWRPGGLAGAEPTALHINGSSVHLITWRPGGTGNDFLEAVYLVGGAAEPLEAASDENCTSHQGGGIHNIVERMRGPSQAIGTWETMSPLNYPRVNHNTVILLDGSLLVIGGQDAQFGACLWRKEAELYRPAEIDDVDPATAPGWTVLAFQTVVRQYHAAAVMLPDGSVVSVGGKNLPCPAPCQDPSTSLPDHSIEIFKPPYFFIGPRPEIDVATLVDPAVGAYDYGDELVQFEVTSYDAVQRVALLRNGSNTHAFDPDQRYVELRMLPPVPDPDGVPNKWLLTVMMPPHARQAPPGYYLLTAVDVQGRPSEGEWLRIEDQP